MAATNKIVSIENVVVEKEFNSRIIFNIDKMEELKKSILENGLRYPITVKKVVIGGDDLSKYEQWSKNEKIPCSNNVINKEEVYCIIGGERRYRCHVELKEEGHAIKGIKCQIEKATMRKDVALLTSFIENMGESFNHIEEAHLFYKLINVYNWDIEEVSKKIGKRVAIINSRLNLLDGSKEVQEAITNKEITLGTAQDIIKNSNGDLEKQKEVIEQIKETGINKIQEEKKKKKEEKIKNKLRKEVKEEVKKEMNYDELDEGEDSTADTDEPLDKNDKKTKVIIKYDDWKDEVDQLVHDIKNTDTEESHSQFAIMYSYSRLCVLIEIFNLEIEKYITDEEMEYCEGLMS